MSRKRAERIRMPPGLTRCTLCGYDHDVQFERAQAWHEQHDSSIGESHDPMSLEDLRR